jgi:hypothetical protein
VKTAGLMQAKSVLKDLVDIKNGGPSCRWAHCAQPTAQIIPLVAPSQYEVNRAHTSHHRR